MQAQTISTGTMFKGSYGTAYDAGTDSLTDKVKTGKRGRPAAVAPVAFIANPVNDLFGRVPVVAPNNIRGTVIKGSASIEE